MSVNYDVYVGPYLKCKVLTEDVVTVYEIVGEDFYASWYVEDGSYTTIALAPLTSIRGIDRETNFPPSYDDYEDYFVQNVDSRMEVTHLQTEFLSVIAELRKISVELEASFGIVAGIN